MVDDDDDSRQTTIDILHACEFDTLAATCGEEGLERFRESSEKIHTVVLDMTMPGMSGVETYEHMVDILPDVRVLIVSGFTMESRLQQLIDMGKLRFLAKPFSMGTLVDRLLRWE